MTEERSRNLQTLLHDAHAHFFLLKGEQIARLTLWEIRDDSLIIEMPVSAPMRRNLLGLIPALDGSAVYEIEGAVQIDPLPDQMPGTLRLAVDPKSVRRVNRRLYPRVSFTPPLAVEIANEANASRCSGKLINLSAGGLRVETIEELPAEGAFRFLFEIELREEVHALSPLGRIVYEMPLESGFAYGIKFIETESKTAAGEASVNAITQTADLIGLVNKLLICR